MPELTGSTSDEDHTFIATFWTTFKPQKRGETMENRILEKANTYFKDGLDSDPADDEFGPTDNRCLIAGDDVDLDSIFPFDARGVASIDDLVVLLQEKVDAKGYFRSYTPRDAKAIQQPNENANAIIKPIERTSRRRAGYLNQHRFTIPYPYDI